MPDLLHALLFPAVSMCFTTAGEGGIGRAVWDFVGYSGIAVAVLGVVLQAVHEENSHLCKYFWPPSRQSTPCLASILLSFVVIMWKTFFAEYGITPESRRVRQLKRRLILAQMTAALEWNEHRRLEEEDSESEPNEVARTSKKPPTTLELYSMMYDDVEERHVVEYGTNV